MKTVATLLGALVIATAIYAHEHEEFEAWMKQTGANFAGAQKGVAAKQAAETIAAGDKLAQLFDHVKAHFEDDKLPDGVELAKTGHAAAIDLSAAAKAGNWEKASADVKAIGGTCQTCHAAHRVKTADGKFEMK